MRDELARLRLNGRATDSQFAQNPLPVVRAMGLALAEFHREPVRGHEGQRTAAEVALALDHLRSGGLGPDPFARIRPATLIAELENGPPIGRPLVRTHGAPVVGAVVLTDSVATWDGPDAIGHDPAERDLAIVLRSIAETFASEATAAFLDAYEYAGGSEPHGPTLDWYGLVAAFR